MANIIVTTAELMSKYNNWIDNNNYQSEEILEADFNFLKQYAYQNFKYNLTEDDYIFLIKEVEGAVRAGTGIHDIEIENESNCAFMYLPMESVLDDVDSHLLIVELIRKELGDISTINPDDLLTEVFLNNFIELIKEKDSNMSNEQIKKLIEWNYQELYNNMNDLAHEQSKYREQVFHRASLTFKDRIDRIIEERMFN